MNPSPFHVATDLCGGLACPMVHGIFVKNLLQMCKEVSDFAAARFRTKLPDLHVAIQGYDFEFGHCCPIALFPPYILSGGFHMILNSNRICKEKQGMIKKIVKHFEPKLGKIPAGELAPLHLVLGQLAIQSGNAPLLDRIFESTPLPNCVKQAFLINAMERGGCCVVQSLFDNGASPIAVLHIDEKEARTPMDFATGMENVYHNYFKNEFTVDMIDANMFSLSRAVTRAVEIDPQATFLKPDEKIFNDYALVASLATIAPQDPRLALKLVRLFEPYIGIEIENDDSILNSSFKNFGHLLEHHAHGVAPRRNSDHTAIVLADAFLFAVLPLLRAGGRMWRSEAFDEECRLKPILACIGKSKFKRYTGTFAQMMLESRSFASKGIDMEKADPDDEALISKYFPSLQLFARRAIVSRLPIGIEKRLRAINALPLLSHGLKRFLNFSDFDTQLRKISYHPDNEHPRHQVGGRMINPERENADGVFLHAHESRKCGPTDTDEEDEEAEICEAIRAVEEAKVEGEQEGEKKPEEESDDESLPIAVGASLFQDQDGEENGNGCLMQ